MISGAEARRISRALESVAAWAGEIVVVLNADVSDGTEEIAAKFGAKVFREPWKGHVAQKNSAAAKATLPWVLGLDADEVVSPELQREIAGLLERAGEAERCAAYSFPRCTFYLGRWIRHGDWYPDRQTRLWQRGRARWGGVDPHDKIHADGPVGKLRGELLHYAAETFDQQMRKTVLYANLFAQQCAAESRKVSLLELAVRPPWRFVRGYLLRLGFLDGWAGFCVAWMGVIYTFLRYAKAIEAQRAGEPIPPPPA
jgi:glycosyltransferase involved in cell wall biosynthesis